MITTLNQSQYLQAVGLLTLAAQHYKQMQAIEKSLAELLEMEPDAGGCYDHVSDAIWSGELDLNLLLRKLNISVEDVSTEAQTWAEG